MATLSFISGLPPFWILNKLKSSLTYLITLTSGLLLSTCINIVLPEALSQLSNEKLNSSSLGPQILLGFITLYSLDIFSSIFTNYFNDSNNIIEIENQIEVEIEISNTLQSNLENDLNSFFSIPLKSYIFSVLSNSTTLGLLFHCLTDGIILTTTIISNNSSDDSNHSNHSNNSLLIILAIFLHKLPASFSLTSILLNQKLKKNIIIFHLFLFSISAPIGAWLTLVLSNLLGFKETSNSNSFILLFSTGAFLYVSFHTFISCHKHDNDSLKLSNHSSDSSIVNWNYLITMIGMLIPLIVSFTHDD
ncbi:hypothetical protein C6P40_001565 [Pichia californica]|uniref:Zinc/iron permease n=1 Tax=Pichia californica TaxID=460514 RepID=A0A9P7BDD8_9ASCO|nr:hypothetical protein C6P42_001635 [[Candida] californica]KAG0687977.1 hypothetical protein C6P40_001565 [[Candida] californica]